ncbi:Zinc-finger homeodomain protein 6 [Heracleum sosnowskyi]|uniref:Zinc-finger homeodomain protein 6 n=1 Tax=Heracleum sosnowskyi TaxID=360622 RepID=A0AAD8M7G9_9APIA|nr:Zinc-finger homeodomain protein 6 [Heracleum sosnowskyi]
MALNGTEKEMRMPPGSSWSSETLDHNNNNNNNNTTPNHHHLSDHHHQDLSDRFQVMPISVGSKLKLPTKYRECLKNHAATIGGHVTDGCGEFMPSGEDGTLEALKCAACNCHRNFHRKESTNPYAADTSEFSRTTAVHPLPLPLPAPMPSPSGNRHRNVHTPLNMHSNHWAPVVPPVKMAFGSGSGAATDSSSEELNFNAGGAVAPPYGSPKKRFRTKFTQEQKEKMMEFAEKVGWRIPREDDAQVQRFCGEIGVKRQVFKVWMHNNKSTSAVSAPPVHIVNIDADAAAAAAVAGEVAKDKQIQDSTYGD